MNPNIRNAIISISIAIVIATIGTIVWSVACEYGTRFVEWIDR